MKFCGNCGNPLKEGEKSCSNCGASVNVSRQKETRYQTDQKALNHESVKENAINDNMQYAPSDAYRNRRNSGSVNNINDKWDYTPISMWGYFGYEILFMIPIIGFILLLIFSFGGTQRINLRNFARSYFCLLIISVIIIFIVWIRVASMPYYYW